MKKNLMMTITITVIILIAIVPEVSAVYQGPDVYVNQYLTGPSVTDFCSLFGRGPGSYAPVINWEGGAISYARPAEYSCTNTNCTFLIHTTGGLYYPAYNVHVTKFQYSCSGNWEGSGNGQVLYDNSSIIGDWATVYKPITFTGYPLDGGAPLDVDFTVHNASQVNSSGFSWSWGDGQTLNTNISLVSHTYQEPGIYTVILTAYNTTGNLEETVKKDYILVSNASGMAVNLDIKNAITGALVQDTTVGIRNTTTGVWRNTTAPTGLVYFTSTDPGYLYPLTIGQSITLAANKSGYQDASTTFNIPYNNYRAILYMMPSSVVNATGNGTVVVNVVRALTGLTVSGMSVALDSGHVGITNTAGAVTLFNVSAGNRTATVTDPSGTYLPTEKTFALAAGETKLVSVMVARDDDPPITDPNSTPVSPTPTPVRTYDPNDPNSPVYGNYTTSEINQQGGAGVLAMLAQLIALWPAIVVFAFLKFMRSAMT